MFSILLRAALTFVLAPILIIAWRYPMQGFVNAIEDIGVEESSHAYYLATTIEWLPLIVLLSLVFWVIAGALEQREAVGVR